MTMEHENHWRMDSYQYPLEAVIGCSIEQWSRQRDASLPKDPRVWTVLNGREASFIWDELPSEEDIVATLERAADAAMDMMDRPGTSRDKGMNDLACVLTELHLPGMCELFEESLQVRLSRRGIVTPEAAHRLCLLAGCLWLINGPSIAPSIMSYLPIVVRTYVYGLDASCIDACGSAIEQVLRSTVPDNLCERLLGPRDRYSVADRVTIAKNEHFFHRGPAQSNNNRNTSLAKVAHGVWLRRNKVVHDDPSLTEKVDETVYQTFEVIAALTADRDIFRLPWD